MLFPEGLTLTEVFRMPLFLGDTLSFHNKRDQEKCSELYTEFERM